MAFDLFSEVFEKVVADHPDETALVFEGNSITYSELNRRSNQVAYYLRSLVLREIDFFITKGTVVGLHLQPSIHHVVCLLGIWKAGMVYCPLTTNKSEYGIDRLSKTIETAQPAIIITDHLNDLKVCVKDAKTLSESNAFLEETKKYSVENPGVKVSGDSLAYIISTSGSSGTPKLVLLAHRGIPNLAIGMNRAFFGENADIKKHRFGQIADISFDAHIQEIVCALGAGIPLVIVPMNIRLNEENLGKYCSENSITILTLTPAVLERFAPVQFETLQIITSTGDKISKTAIDAWLRAGKKIFDGYGVTEATVASKMRQIFTTEGIDLSLGSLSAGLVGEIEFKTKEARNSESEIVHELIITSANVDTNPLALGYYGDEGVRKEAFGVDDGIPFYRTGDVVDLEQFGKGSLVIKGRLNSTRVIKISGKLVNLREVEEALKSSNLFKEVFVHPYVKKGGAFSLHVNTVLRAFVGLDATIDQSDVLLKTYRLLRGTRLPETSFPARFCFIKNTFPMKASKKEVDLDKLIKNEDDYYFDPDADQYVRPKNFDLNPCSSKVCRQVSDIWKEVLALEDDFQISPTDNFFFLGGNSLRFLHLKNLLAEKFKNVIYEASCSELRFGQLVYDIEIFSQHKDEFKNCFHENMSRAEKNSHEIFLIHSLLGDAMSDFSELVKGWTDTICHGLSLPKKAAFIPDTIEDLASLYVRLILDREIQLDTYIFVGYSFGGFVAQEMVRQMRVRGKKAEAVLLDTSYSLDPINRMSPEDYRRYIMGALEVVLRGEDGSLPVLSDDVIVNDFTPQGKAQFVRGLIENLRQVYNSDEDQEKLNRCEVIIRASCFYSQKIEGDVYIVTTKSSERFIVKDQQDNHIGRIITKHVPGADHFDLLTKFVRFCREEVNYFIRLFNYFDDLERFKKKLYDTYERVFKKFMTFDGVESPFFNLDLSEEKITSFSPLVGGSSQSTFKSISLDEIISPNQKVRFVLGPAGFGKSSLMIELARRALVSKKYSIVFWLPLRWANSPAEELVSFIKTYYIDVFSSLNWGREQSHNFLTFLLDPDSLGLNPLFILDGWNERHKNIDFSFLDKCKDLIISFLDVFDKPPKLDHYLAVRVNGYTAEGIHQCFRHQGLTEQEAFPSLNERSNFLKKSPFILNLICTILKDKKRSVSFDKNFGVSFLYEMVLEQSLRKHLVNVGRLNLADHYFLTKEEVFDDPQNQVLLKVLSLLALELFLSEEFQFSGADINRAISVFVRPEDRGVEQLIFIKKSLLSLGFIRSVVGASFFDESVFEFSHRLFVDFFSAFYVSSYGFFVEKEELLLSLKNVSNAYFFRFIAYFFRKNDESLHRFFSFLFKGGREFSVFFDLIVVVACLNECLSCAQLDRSSWLNNLVNQVVELLSVFFKNVYQNKKTLFAFKELHPIIQEKCIRVDSSGVLSENSLRVIMSYSPPKKPIPLQQVLAAVGFSWLDPVPGRGCVTTLDLIRRCIIEFNHGDRTERVLNSLSHIDLSDYFGELNYKELECNQCMIFESTPLEVIFDQYQRLYNFLDHHSGEERADFIKKIKILAYAAIYSFVKYQISDATPALNKRFKEFVSTFKFGITVSGICRELFGLSQLEDVPQPIIPQPQALFGYSSFFRLATNFHQQDVSSQSYFGVHNHG